MYAKAIIFSSIIFYDHPSCQRLKQSKYTCDRNQTIRRNRKFLPQDFGRCLKLAKRNIFAEVQFLLPPFMRKVIPSHAFYSPPTARQKIWNTIVCVMVKKTGYKPSTAQSYNDFMGGVHSLDAMSDSCTDERIRVKYWKKNVSILFQEWF
jgi:hypothetical protein